MRTNCISAINFKQITLPKPSETEADKPESQKIREHMEKTGLSSKPVKIGGTAGFIAGAAYGLVKNAKMTSIAMYAVCASGFGIVVGKVINHLNNMKEANK